MTKEELEKYARDNRKRLEAQEVKLGDVVEVLVGQFAGEKGVIVGILACGNDYTDPYYEIDMACEVPDKYKCRKTLITPNNVIGGLSAYEFKVVGNRAPEKPTDKIKVGDRVKTPKGMGTVKYACGGYLTVMLDNGEWWVSMNAILPKEDKPTDEIKCGDIVRVKDDAPKDVWQGGNSKSYSTRYKFIPFEVVQIEEDGLETYAYTISTDGFLHCRIPTRYLEPYYTAEDVRRMEEDLQREKEQHLREHSGKEDSPNGNTITIPVKADLDDTYWESYRAELVKEIAVKLADKETIMCPSIADYTTNFATRIVDNLKQQSE